MTRGGKGNGSRGQGEIVGGRSVDASAASASSGRPGAVEATMAR
jgi:hypothetical protein